MEIKCGFANGSTKKLGSLSPAKVERVLQEFPSLSKVWLLTGEGSMTTGGQPGQTQEACIVQTDNEAPLVPEEVSRSADVNVWDYVHSCNVERITLAQLFPSHDMFYRVISNSMKPAIEKGDVLVLKKMENQAIISGECYLIDSKLHCMMVRT